MLTVECGGTAAGSGIASASPSRSTRPRAPSACIACTSASTPSGVIAPSSRIVNTSASRCRNESTGRQVDQSVDGFDAELVVDELDDEREDRTGTGIVDPVGASFVSVVQRRLEAVMAVGEHDGRRRDKA